MNKYLTIIMHVFNYLEHDIVIQFKLGLNKYPLLISIFFVCMLKFFGYFFNEPILKVT